MDPSYACVASDDPVGSARYGTQRLARRPSARGYSEELDCPIRTVLEAGCDLTAQLLHFSRARSLLRANRGARSHPDRSRETPWR